jgi:hypothetical protein
MDMAIGETEKLELEGAERPLTKKEKKELKRKGKTSDDRDEEMKRLQREVEEWKRKAEQMEMDKKLNNRALGFSVEKYMELSYIEAAKWIANDVTQAFKARMDEQKEKFYWTKLVRGKYSMGARTCARFNRGEYCSNGKWHTIQRPSTDREEPEKELRLHGCTLCLEALGIWSVHPVVDCQWLFEKTWMNLGN